MQSRYRPYEAARAIFHLALAIVGVAAATAGTAHASQASATNGRGNGAPAAERLVLAFGDSLTAGYRLAPDESFPAQLEAQLRLEGRRVRVHNAGVSGDTTAGGKARLNWVLKGLGRDPDLVILELGANDMLRGVDPKVTRANLDAMMAEFDRRGVPIILAGMFAAPSLGIAYIDAFNGIYPELARKYDATLYPFFMEGVLFNRTLLLDDGLHPNARGVGTIVDNILPTVRKALDGLPREAVAPPVSVQAGATGGSGDAAPVRRD
jgi:acyl-CoA thioesterase-1